MDKDRYEKDLAAYLLVVYSHFMSTLVCFNWQATKLMTIQILWPVHNQSSKPSYTHLIYSLASGQLQEWMSEGDNHLLYKAFQFSRVEDAQQPSAIEFQFYGIHLSSFMHNSVKKNCALIVSCYGMPNSIVRSKQIAHQI